jgi:hypothetical protein
MPRKFCDQAPQKNSDKYESSEIVYESLAISQVGGPDAAYNLTVLSDNSH